MSTKPKGCFYCSGKATQSDGNCDKCGRSVDVSDTILKARLERFEPVSIIGRGFYGWTVKALDEHQAFAIKVIPSHRLSSPLRESAEIEALVRCSTHRNLVRFYQAFTTEIGSDHGVVDVSCLVFDFIPDASPLRQFLKRSPDLSKSDAVGILRGITFGLARMHSVDLWHDDLHDDNILVRAVRADENLAERYEPKLIDFGSAKPKTPNEPEHGSRSDYFYLAKHVLSVAATFESVHLQHLTPSDRAFLQVLRILARELADPDVTRRRLGPTEVAQRLQDCLAMPASASSYPSVEVMLTQRELSIKRPFASPNALHLQPQDVQLLFVDALGWKDQVDKSQPVVIVGPRGCGKTMLLRHLSLRSMGRPASQEMTREMIALRLRDMPSLGVLVSCGDLRTPFFRSSFEKLRASDPALADDFCREYISLHFALELARGLSWLLSEQLAPVDDESLESLAVTMAHLLSPVARFTAAGQQDMMVVVEALERRVVALSNVPEDYVPSSYCSEDCLDQLSRTASVDRWLADRRITYLLDDYSVPLLPVEVQRAYNPVIFRPTTGHTLRVSSEGEGPRLDDRMARRYRAGREFSRINLGEVYFESSEKAGVEFLERIMEARFAGTGVDFAELRRVLGEHSQESGFGQYILERKRPGDARFYGFRLLCQLCSGDIGSILELFDKLYDARERAKNGRMSPKVQDSITKRYAQEELRTLHQVHEWGPKLNDFATALGALLKDYLLESGGSKPDERLRIEIEGGGDLSSDSMDMHEQLLRHSVIISGGSGKSRAGLPTRRYFFRRLYAPCFPFSPNRGGCVSLTWAEYETWLSDPSKISRKTKESGDDHEGGAAYRTAEMPGIRSEGGG